MRTPNERISDLEAEVRQLKDEVFNLVTTLGWAVHKSLDGMLEAKKLSYIEKRIIWGGVAKDMEECLSTNPRLSHHLGYRLQEVERRGRAGS